MKSLTFIFVFTLLSSMEQPPKPCKTTFVVTDCSDQGVPGATVQIETCSDKKSYGISTDVNGKATFAICKSDICKSKVTFVGYSATLGGNCSGPDENTTCTIKICDKAKPLGEIKVTKKNKP